MAGPDGPIVTGNPNWVKGMKSPNPSGRPPGVSPQSKLIQKMLENADGILDAIIAKAMEGDSSSASLILARIVPALKSQAQTVQFDFDHTAPASEQAASILSAIASGAVSPDVGRQIMEAVNALTQIKAGELLEARIAALEEKQS
ncbi:hypothetical protein [Sphingomonas faeni]|uniref:hypothetical protein n=1 Tax=Sphingomonas faeni TaxID=185950 RepID=UPI0033559415